jgi:hypothetical protein
MNPRSSSKSRILAWLAIAALPIAVVSSESLAWWWKNPPESGEGRNLLTYAFPPDSGVSLREPVPEGVMSALSCDDADGGLINGGGGRQIKVNYFEWNNTETSGLSDAFGHTPEICMGNLGSKVEAFLPNRRFAIEGRELVFDATQFRDQDGGPLYIFKLAWAEGMEGANILREGSSGATARSFKFKSVVRRWFPRYARVLMLGVWGTRNDAEAWELVRDKVLKDLTFRNVKS